MKKKSLKQVAKEELDDGIITKEFYQEIIKLIEFNETYKPTKEEMKGYKAVAKKLEPVAQKLLAKAIEKELKGQARVSVEKLNRRVGK